MCAGHSTLRTVEISRGNVGSEMLCSATPRLRQRFLQRSARRFCDFSSSSSSSKRGHGQEELLGLASHCVIPPRVPTKHLAKRGFNPPCTIHAITQLLPDSLAEKQFRSYGWMMVWTPPSVCRVPYCGLHLRTAER